MTPMKLNKNKARDHLMEEKNLKSPSLKCIAKSREWQYVFV